MQILIPERTYRRLQGELATIAPEASFVVMDNEGKLTRDGKPVEAAETQIEVAWASRDLYVDVEGSVIREFMIAILKSEEIRWMHSGGAGFDHPIFGAISDKGVALTNSDAGAVAMAEYVVGAVLAHYQRLDLRKSFQAEHRWKKVPFREVAGTRWLVVGFGNIGREVATRARALGAYVVGVRRTPTGEEAADEMITPAEVHDALPAADVIVLSAALNESTRQLVDAQFLAQVSDQAVLVNVARGGIIDEPALLVSLGRGVPEHAVLDVFESEPLPEQSPFWEHPRVALTSHSAASGSGSTARSDAGFLENLSRYVAGQPLQRQVDPSEFG